tara:strand:+ start:264 stop:869 length:606 start_codon:yes stop_codon:yes gene_type:complete
MAIFVRQILPNQREFSRKIVHIGIGPVIPLAWWLKIPTPIAIIASSVVTIVLIINYRFRFISAVEDVDRKSYGTIAYATSITILLILFWNEHPEAVSAGVLMMAFADGLAGLVGRKISSPKWKIVGQEKSFLGTLTMGLVGMLILYFMVQISGSPIDLLRIFAIASLAVSLEQISPWGIDNLSVPIAVTLSWGWMTNISIN